MAAVIRVAAEHRANTARPVRGRASIEVMAPTLGRPDGAIHGRRGDYRRWNLVLANQNAAYGL
jgi:hypothetical protein